MKTNKIFVIALCLLVLISIAACTPQDTGFNNNTERMSTQTRLSQNNNWNRDDSWDNGMNTTVEDDLNNGIRNNRTNNLNNGMVRNNTMTTSLGNRNTQARDLAKRISNLPEVDSASVVLNDNNCIVGVDLKGTNNTISTSLRQKIENMVKDTNNINTNNVSITSDPDLITRVKTLSNGMTNTVGNDVNNFTNDFEELIRDIVPGGRGNN